MKGRFAAVVAVFGFVLVPSGAGATGTAAGDVALEIQNIVASIRQIRSEPSLDQDDKLKAVISFAQTKQRFFLIYAILHNQWGVVVSAADVAAATAPNLAAVEQARTDMQSGASPSASGTSSLIAKASAPSFFAAAVEQGALLESTDSLTTTFHGNLMGLLDLLGSGGYVRSYADDGGLAKFSRRISFAFTLKNASSINADAIDSGPIAAVQRQIADLDERLEQYSVRAVVGKNRRDPRDEDNRTALRALMDTKGQAVLAALDDALGDLQLSDEYDQWRDESARELKAVPLPFLDGALIKRLNILSDLAAKLVPQFETKALEAYKAYAAFLSARSTVLEHIEARPVVAVEYVRRRKAVDPDLSTYRLIAEGQKGRWDLSLNASYTGYDNRSDGGGAIAHDFQIGAEADRPLGDRNSRGQSNSPLGNAVLAFAFLYERLQNPGTITFAGRSIAAPSGNLYIGQVKVTLPMNDSGLKIPLSLSFSNRTELLDEKEIRANLGFTFNFNAVAAALWK